MRALAQIEEILREVEYKDTEFLLMHTRQDAMENGNRPVDPGYQYRQGYLTALREAVEILEEEDEEREGWE